MFHRIETAKIEYRNGRPHSRQYQDIYFAGDGPNETLRSFMEPAKVNERFANSRLFTIFELGFGTGLNFLVAATEFSKKAPEDARLRFFSCEKHPLMANDVLTALKPWSSEFPIHQALLDSWPPPIPGWHRRHFLDGKVEFSVYHGDVKEAVNDFVMWDQRGVDAWFLDGFAPQRNPDMWDPDVFHLMFKRTNTHGTVTTFSSAGVVRRSLENAGFKVSRIDAEPFKKHTTLALVPNQKQFTTPSVTDVTVIGAGIVGSTLACALARKRVNVCLIESCDSPAQMTSSIPVAIQHGRLSSADTLPAEFKAHSYIYSTALSKQFGGVRQMGAIHIPNQNMPYERLEAVANIVGPDWCRKVTRAECSEELSIRTERGAFYFPKSNVVNGPEFCLSMIENPRIRLQQRRVRSSQSLEVPTVWATGSDVSDVPKLPPLEIASLDGQIDTFAVLNESTRPDVAVVYDGYVVRIENNVTAGSTYEYQQWEHGKASTTNQARITSIFSSLSFDWRSKFRGTRLVTSDRFPIAGRIADHLWLNIGYGSSGTTTAPFLAESLASQIVGEIPPGSRSSVSISDPHRFASRQARRPNPFTKRYTNAK